MGFFSTQNYSAGDTLKTFLFKKVAWKLLAILIGWLILYFATQYLKEGIASLFNLLVGCLAGLVIGWTLAEDAVQDSGLTGFTLWTMLTLFGCIPILLVEGVMYLITNWEMGLGRWMCMSSAIIMTMASVVWRASADD